MKDIRWSAFRNKITNRLKVSGKKAGDGRRFKNIYVIVAASLVFAMIINFAIFSIQVRAKEPVKTTEVIKPDTLIGGEFHETLKELSRGMSGELSGLNEYLEKLDQLVLNNQKELEDINMMTEEKSNEVIVMIENSIRELKNNLNNIHEQISDTRESITGLLVGMEQNNADRHIQTMNSIADVNTAIDNVNSSIVQINNDLETTHTDLVRLLENMKASADKNHAETVQKLEAVETNISAAITQNMAEITQQFTSLSTSFKEQVENLSQSMEGNFETLNQSLALQFETISNTITNSSGQTDNSLKEYLDQMQAALQQNLNQVFTYVSNGKQLLASALLTKSVSIDQDATFKEIEDAILRIPQKLVIGVEELPGEIEYEYHYHTDAEGNNPHAATSDEKGGCYTTAVYHVHTSANGCYRTEYYHSHTSDCPKKPIWVDWVDPPYWGASYKCGDQPNNESRQVLTCSKSSGTIDYYTPSCGLSDGQIIAAHIVYKRPADAPETAAAISFEVPKDILIPAETETNHNPQRLSDEELESLGLNRDGPHEEATETSTETATSSETETITETKGSLETETVTETESEYETDTTSETETSPETENRTEIETETESQIADEAENNECETKDSTSEGEVPQETEAADDSGSHSDHET